MDEERFNKAKEKALRIMSKTYDPFHDEYHVLEVEEIATRIHHSLDRFTRKTADLESIRLACLFHDTSRKVIKTNLLLQPFLDGYLSGNIAYSTLLEVGYSAPQAFRVRRMINDHETILGLVKRDPDISCKIFADADCISGYSSKRIGRAIKRFEQGKFSNILLNVYVLALVYLHKNKTIVYNFEISRQMTSQHILELKNYLLAHRQEIKKMLYRPVYHYLYTIGFLSS